MSEFIIVDSIAQVLGRADQGMTCTQSINQDFFYSGLTNCRYC